MAETFPGRDEQRDKVAAAADDSKGRAIRVVYDSGRVREVELGAVNVGSQSGQRR
jgi:hypothetical protein